MPCLESIWNFRKSCIFSWCELELDNSLKITIYTWPYCIARINLQKLQNSSFWSLSCQFWSKIAKLKLRWIPWIFRIHPIPFFFTIFLKMVIPITAIFVEILIYRMNSWKSTTLPKFSLLWFFLKNYNLSLKLQVLKFLGIQP